MIDVVFLLLVFFMLASRFGIEAAIPLPLASGGGRYDGPPRIVEVLPEGLRLNGLTVSEDAVAEALRALVRTPGDAIVLRGREGADMQRIVSTADALGRAGLANLVLVE